MSLIVENGSGKVDAESYISVADASTRHSNLGNTNWAALSNSEMEQALRRATVFMEQAYRTRWIGCRVSLTQSLSWPRYGAVVEGYAIDSETIPADIAHACADFAVKAAAGDLNEDLTRAVVREKVGPLETEYDRNSSQSVRYRAQDMALSPYLKGSSSMVRLERA